MLEVSGARTGRGDCITGGAQASACVGGVGDVRGGPGRGGCARSGRDLEELLLEECRQATTLGGRAAADGIGIRRHRDESH